MRHLASPVPTHRELSSLCTAVVLALGLSACESKATDEGSEAVAEDTGDDGEDEGAEWQVPARGNIALTDVVVNQGVDVAIARNGEWVGPEERNTFVVGNRDTLVRAFWDIPDDWTPRKITGKLELEFPDGTGKVLESSPLIETDSYPGDLDRSFYWPLLAEDFPPGTKFHITLWEGEEGYADLPESTTLLESPIGGLQQIGIQSEPLQIKVEFVPVRYQTPNCNTDTSTIDDATKQKFIDSLHERNPVQEVIFNFRDDATIEWNTPLDSLAELWQPLLDMRAAENAAPNVYYYALVDVCGGGIGDAAGIAPGTPPPTKDAAMMRVSSGIYQDNDSYTYQVFVHEVGHNQGRPHTFCEGGGAAGTDPAYPYDNGVIGVWGFGIRIFKLYNPTGTFDYMSYCGPYWVSDWTWGKIFNQVKTLTSWDFEAGGDMGQPEGEVLIGLLMKNGEERWFTAAGGREPEYFSGAQKLAFAYGDAMIEVPAAIEVLEDGSHMVMAPIPRPQEQLVQVQRIDDEGISRDVPLATIDTADHFSF